MPDPVAPKAEGNEQPPVGGGGNPSVPTGDEFDRAKLHPVLRDMSPEQINDLMETMSVALRAGKPTDAAPAAPAPELKLEPPGDVKKMMDPNAPEYDPERALDFVIRKNYGGAVRDMGSRTIRAAMIGLRSEFDDFQEYEQDILTAIRDQDPSTVTDKQLLAMYFQAKGLKSTMKSRSDKAKNAGATTLAPTPPTPPKKDEELSDVEKEVARRMFRRYENPEAKYKEYLATINKPMEMKVPIGDGKVA